MNLLKKSDLQTHSLFEENIKVFAETLLNSSYENKLQYIKEGYYYGEEVKEAHNERIPGIPHTRKL